MPVNMENINWDTLVYDDRAALCFIMTETHILLIRKKKGLGAGKMDAPGGRIEPGETDAEAAVRELKEEIGLVPENPKKMAEFHFHFLSGYALFCSVFTATAYSGRLIETDEAAPSWFLKEHIPYDQMWEDNRLWLPEILSGKSLKGFFIFEDDKMISSKITVVPGY
jgi:8-oxo-dGTP diphosphatase